MTSLSTTSKPADMGSAMGPEIGLEVDRRPSGCPATRPRHGPHTVTDWPDGRHNFGRFSNLRPSPGGGADPVSSPDLGFSGAALNHSFFSFRGPCVRVTSFALEPWLGRASGHFMPDHVQRSRAVVFRRCTFSCDFVFLKIPDDEFGWCVYLIQLVEKCSFAEKMCRSELWFSRNGFGHSCRAGGWAQTVKGAGKVDSNASAVCRPPAADAHRRGFSQTPGHTRDIMALCGARNVHAHPV